MTPAPNSFYTTGGTLSQNAPSYVERQADLDLLDGLRAGEFCYVLTSRQMGKSSLMVRAGRKLRERGVQTIALDLTAVGQNVTPEQWYDGLLAQMGRQAHLEEPLDEFWLSKERLGPCQRFFAAIRDVILPREKRHVVIFVDEIDTVRSLPFSTDEFFAAIRECYNRRVQDEEFRRLTFCLLGVATPSDLIRDTRTTPFNIGRRIELHDFTEEEAAPLTQGLPPFGSTTETPLLVDGKGERPTAGARQPKRLLSRILYWTGGHPYLTQRFCRAVAEEGNVRAPGGVDRICNELFLSNRAKERDDNLLFVRERLLRSEVDVPSLLELYLKVRRGEEVEDDETSPRVNVLRLSGIVKATQGRLETRNLVYSRVFDDSWVDSNMPDADRRRLRAAFFRGVMRTSAIAALIVAVVGVAALFAIYQAQQASLALARLSFSEAQTRRSSPSVGRRIESLEALRRARRDYGDKQALRDEAIACLALIDLQPVFARTNFPEQTTAVALSPTLTHYALGDEEGTIQLHRMSDGQIETRLPGIGLPVEWTAVSSDGRYVAAGYRRENQARFAVWNAGTRQILFESTNRVVEATVDFSSDNSKLVARLTPASLEVLALPSGERLDKLTVENITEVNTARASTLVEESKTALSSSSLPRRTVLCARFDWAGKQIAESGPNSLRAYIRTLRTASTNATDTDPPYYAFRPDDITRLAWAPDGEHLVTAGNTGPLSIWDIKLKRARPLPLVHADVVDLAFSPDGTLLASLARDWTLRVWCQATGRYLTQVLDAEPDGRIFFSADSQRIGLASRRAGIRIWQIHGNKEYRVIRAPTHVDAPLMDVAFDPEGRVIVGANPMGVFLWDAATSRLVGSATRSAPEIRFFLRSITVDPLRGDLFAVGVDQILRWQREVSGGAQRFTVTNFADFPKGLKNCRITPDGKRGIAVYQSDLYGFQINSPAPERLPFHGSFHSPVFSPKGRWLAESGKENRPVQVWSVENPSEGPIITKPALSGTSFAFSPDDRYLLVSSERGYQFWDTTSWTRTGRLDAAPAAEGGAVAFCALDGERSLLAVADGPGSVSLFQFESRGTNATHGTRLLARLRSPDLDRIGALVFSPQCRRLAVVTGQTAGIWDLALLHRGLAELELADDLPEIAIDAEHPLSVSIDQELPKPRPTPASL